MSNKGKWDSHYRNAPPYFIAYGESLAYKLGAEALGGCDTVEDWGCGLGWFKIQLSLHSPDVKYIGIDGSRSPHADVVADLSTYTSQAEGIFMRHVLEHNYDWPVLLNNALQSFTKRLVLVVFTPFSDSEEWVKWDELRFEEEYGVPTLALNRELLIGDFGGLDYTERTIVSPNTAYGSETVFVVSR